MTARRAGLAAGSGRRRVARRRRRRRRSTARDDKRRATARRYVARGARRAAAGMALPDLRRLSISAQVGGSDTLNHLGPQSTRPLPRWYWRSKKQNRWRRFDDNCSGMSRNKHLEHKSERESGGLTPGSYIKWPKGHGGIYIVSWDHTNRSGEFKWSVDEHESFEFERLDQRTSAQVQANNFVYNHSGVEDPAQDLLDRHAHCEKYFRDMIMRELEYARTHVFLYHSYHNVSLIYDIGACLMRVVFGTTEQNKNALLLRTDRSSFNLRTPQSIIDNFDQWYKSTDVFANNPVDRKFAWVGVSAVINLFKSNPESTIVSDFQKGYNPGDSPNLEPVLDELLRRFGIFDLKGELLQYTIEADTDVTSFLGNDAHYFERHDDQWSQMDRTLSQSIDEDKDFGLFMEDDNLTDSVTKNIHGSKIELKRDEPGAQAYGHVTHSGGVTRELITVTKNPGKYLQIGIPFESVNAIAYASRPFGEPNLAQSLYKIRECTDLSKGGQARIIARPDLVWPTSDNQVLQTVHHFSRGAANKRCSYLEKIERLLWTRLFDHVLWQRVQQQLAPKPIVVRTHNVWWENKTPHKVWNRIANGTYDFACLQELTGKMVEQIGVRLARTPHILVCDHACGSSTSYAALVYLSTRFTPVGPPYYGCFMSNGRKLPGRPVVGIVFNDKFCDRKILVMSVHAPHRNRDPYSLTSNLQALISLTLTHARVFPSDVSHVVIAGDYNRDDWWGNDRYVAFGNGHIKLKNAQALTRLETLVPPPRRTNGMPIDNILYGSREWKYCLELDTFDRDADRLGSDHHAVTASFRC